MKCNLGSPEINLCRLRPIILFVYVCLCIIGVRGALAEEQPTLASKQNLQQHAKLPTIDPLNTYNYYGASSSAYYPPTATAGAGLGLGVAGGGAGGLGLVGAGGQGVQGLGLMDDYSLYNSVHGVNTADMMELAKLSKRPLRRKVKSINSIYHPAAMPIIPDYSQLQPNYMQLKPRTEDVWAIDGKAKHLEVLLLFVILAGLLLKVAFSLMWWKQALGGMMGGGGWYPQTIHGGGGGFGGSGGGYGGGGGGGYGGGWGGWRQLSDDAVHDSHSSSGSLINQLTDYVEKAINTKFGDDKKPKNLLKKAAGNKLD